MPRLRLGGLGLRRLDGGLGLRLGGRCGRLARRHLAGLLLLLELAERDGQAAEQPAQAACQTGERRRDHADELPVEDIARRELGDRLDLRDLERLAVHAPRP